MHNYFKWATISNTKNAILKRKKAQTCLLIGMQRGVKEDTRKKSFIEKACQRNSGDVVHLKYDSKLQSQWLKNQDARWPKTRKFSSPHVSIPMQLSFTHLEPFSVFELPGKEVSRKTLEKNLSLIKHAKYTREILSSSNMTANYNDVDREGFPPGVSWSALYRPAGSSMAVL